MQSLCRLTVVGEFLHASGIIVRFRLPAMQRNSKLGKCEDELPFVKALGFHYEGRALLPPPPWDPSLALKPPTSKKSMRGKLRLDPAPGPSDLFEGRLFGLDDLGCLEKRLTCKV